ncbi:hypothetical protein ABZ793_23550 [Micromonospora sp. NPDC047465]|uniref:hypothetical protein n=1 Tax=Micromonospora sp. NPDC047465 TaxID=3154813 RepID=UPI00340EEC49
MARKQRHFTDYDRRHRRGVPDEQITVINVVSACLLVANAVTLDAGGATTH